jgi:hypothetical protein
VEMDKLLKVVYRLHAISIKVPMLLFTKIEKLIKNSYGSTKDPK